MKKRRRSRATNSPMANSTTTCRSMAVKPGFAVREFYFDIGGGVLDDPDTAAVAQTPCADVYPSVTLLAMLRDAGENDVALCDRCDYSANVEVATSRPTLPAFPPSRPAPPTARPPPQPPRPI